MRFRVFACTLLSLKLGGRVIIWQVFLSLWQTARVAHVMRGSDVMSPELANPANVLNGLLLDYRVITSIACQQIGQE
jgi:hypothetical protein